MKDTFKSWLIANIESIVMVMTLPVLLLFYLKIENLDIVGLLVLFCYAALCQQRKLVMDLHSLL